MSDDSARTEAARAYVAHDSERDLAKPRRVFQGVQRTVAGAALVARDARVPAGPEHLARFRPALGRAAERCMQSRSVSDSNA